SPQPGPDDVALGCDLIQGLVAHRLLAERGDHAIDGSHYDSVAVGQSRPVVVLPRRATRRPLAPLPYDIAVPVQLANGAVGKDAAKRGWRGATRSARVGQLHQQFAFFSTGDGGIQNLAGKAPLVPPVHLVAVHVDEVRLAVRRAEHDKT